MTFITNMTAEQRTEALAKAQEARKQKQLDIQSNKHLYKTSYLDMGYWEGLASKYKVRMPSRDEGVSAKILRKYLRKAGVEVETFNSHYTSMKYFVENNPTWSAYAAAGVILELKEGL